MLTIRRLAFVLALVLCANFAAWALVNQSTAERPWGGVINGLSYSGWREGDETNKMPDADIERDMAILAGHTNSIRTYGVGDGLDRIAGAAARHNINVTLGAWISRDKAANAAEVAHLIDTVHANPNVKRVIVGNEALLRDDISVADLIDLIERVKRQVNVPVSTAEPWHVWLKYPQLADSVDFITVHILPYWEGVPEEGALDYVLYRYRQLAGAFPDKHIYIGEVGWPSEGQWVQGAEASQVNQAKFVRDFLNAASSARLDYSVVEAFDAPWKREIEGTVGAHWGLWGADRQPKFPMSGAVTESTRWVWGYLVATLLALYPIQAFVRRRSDLKFAGQVFYAGLVQAVMSVFVWAVMAAMTEKIINSNTIAWIALVAAQIVLLALLLVDGFELTEVIWANERRRKFEPHDWQPPLDAPKVSIHVPCYNEPPHMVISTLNALARLDYPNFEVIVVDNNTKDDLVWKPLEMHCAFLGPRFHFFHLPQWPGFKAGALNFALAQTAPDAAIVGVIDSDYIVEPQWLRATMPYFDKASVAFVQAPQDYRDGNENAFKRLCYWEYAGFFHIGMVQRNERNAIIQHGTMTLIRKQALQRVGGWAEWCICEDAELGLRLFESGFEAVYLDHSFGRGLIPDSFSGYKTQRFRWAFGAVQILKRHWHALKAGELLTTGQRYHFISGWLPWFADAAHVLFATAAIVWSVLLLLHWVEFPPAVFLVPTLSVFLFKIVAGFWLYHARVKCGLRDRLGAAIAGMALSHTVARAVWQGLFTTHKPFLRTPKCEDRPVAIQAFLMAREEIGLLLALIVCGAAVVLSFSTANRDALLWAGMLSVQTLPYLAALFVATVNAWPQKKRVPQAAIMTVAPVVAPPAPVSPAPTVAMTAAVTEAPPSAAAANDSSPEAVDSSPEAIAMVPAISEPTPPVALTTDAPTAPAAPAPEDRVRFY
jgi:exo-beta-1,3-glucanase (GH17 family)/cellulose synthase/poly-beta-1,6-N-acetylglucosamine synthase-like glycosyltransferase